jgi:hypothetical protein
MRMAKFGIQLAQSRCDKSCSGLGGMLYQINFHNSPFKITGLLIQMGKLANPFKHDHFIGWR